MGGCCLRRGTVRPNQRLGLFTLLLTGLLLGAILSDALPYLRGPAPETPEWYWPYQLRPWGMWIKPTAATLLLTAVSALWLRRPSTANQDRLFLLLLAGCSVLLQLCLMNADSANLRDERINRVYSNLESGFFQPAAEITDLGQTLANYPALMPTFSSEHARTHPPGLLLANHLTIRLFERLPSLADRLAAPSIAARCIDPWLLDRPTAVGAALWLWSWLPLGVAAAIVWPGYRLAKGMWGSPTAVKLATLLLLTLPALLIFAPKSVQLYAPLSLLIFYAFWQGLEKWRLAWFFVSGLLFSLATFLSLGNAALAVLLLLYGLWHGWQTRSAGQSVWHMVGRLVGPGLIFALATAVCWLIYAVGWGVSPLAVISTGLSQHYELATHWRRYDWWVLWNLVDLWLFNGLVVMVGATAVLAQLLRGRAVHKGQGLLLATAVMLLIIDLSGSSRGEVGRIWLFFFPFLALVAGHYWAHALPNWRWQAALVAAQLGLTLVIALSWQPVRAVAVVAQRPSMPVVQPQKAVAVRFSQALLLQGYSVEEEAAALNLTLFWQLTQPVLRPYTVFTQLLNEQNEVVSQQDNWPVAGQWPPTCWAVGEQVTDSYRLPIEGLPDGRYRLVVGWYDAVDGRRLLDEAGQDAVLLWEWQRP